jgi:exopolysaccharide biosynthesis polyprenyl glycosylphosphotransferase
MATSTASLQKPAQKNDGFRSTRLELSERRLLLVFGDLVSISCGSIAALWLWSSLSVRQFNAELVQSQLVWMLVVGIIWQFWLIVIDLYNLRLAVRRPATTKRILLGAAVIGLLYTTYFFVRAVPLASSGTTGMLPPLRLAPALGILSISLLLIGWRLTYSAVLGAAHSRRRLLILGAGSAGTTLSQVALNHAHIDLVGFVDDDQAKQSTVIDNVPVLGGHESLLRFVRTYGIDEIALAISAGVTGDMFQTIMDCHERGVSVTPMPIMYEQLAGRVAVEHIGSQWYVALPLAPGNTNLLFRIIKRAMDIVFGAVLMLVFLLTLPVIALAIRLDSRGSIFYRQERVGLHGVPYFVLKYRSMISDAEKDGHARWASKGDSRITRIGNFLRKTRIDELPQAWNVLRGEMSMVGPRPERQHFIDTLQQQIPFYRTRLAAKPGLTGWAQVSYGYGATVEDAMVKLQYDLYYLKHQSPWFDFIILLRTIAVVLRMKGQ